MPNETRVRCPPRLRAKTTSPASGACSAHVIARDGLRVDVEHHQVAVVVDAGHRALLGAAVGEGDQRGAIAQVVGVGQHLVGADHHAGAAAVLADADQCAAHLGDDGASGGGEIVR